MKKARCKLHRAKNGQTKTTVRVHRGLGDDFGCQIQNFIVQGFYLLAVLCDVLLIWSQAFCSDFLGQNDLQ